MVRFVFYLRKVLHTCKIDFLPPSSNEQVVYYMFLNLYFNALSLVWCLVMSRLCNSIDCYFIIFFRSTVISSSDIICSVCIENWIKVQRCSYIISFWENKYQENSLLSHINRLRSIIGIHYLRLFTVVMALQNWWCKMFFFHLNLLKCIFLFLIFIQYKGQTRACSVFTKCWNYSFGSRPNTSLASRSGLVEDLPTKPCRMHLHSDSIFHYRQL